MWGLGCGSPVVCENEMIGWVARGHVKFILSKSHAQKLGDVLVDLVWAEVAPNEVAVACAIYDDDVAQGSWGEQGLDVEPGGVHELVFGPKHEPNGCVVEFVEVVGLHVRLAVRQLGAVLELDQLAAVLKHEEVFKVHVGDRGGVAASARRVPCQVQKPRVGRGAGRWC